jgi:CubicO group peptidase (beta-lactamase class C family)
MGLLGHLLARRADTTYGALVHRRITGPLGLSDTRLRLTDDQEERFAQGHDRLGFRVPPWHFEALAGAGALRSTAADMLDYLQAHRRALRTDPDTASALGRAMQSPLAPRASAGSDGTRVGFGWHETTRDGHRMVVHTGGTGGFKSIALLDRTTGHGAVVLINAALASERVAEAGFALIEALRSD